MNKNLIMVVTFVAVLLGALYFLSPVVDPSTPSKAEFILLDSSMKGGKAPFNVYHPQISVPDVKISDEAGNMLRLDNLKGQNLLINFWATWCVPCREEMPELEALQLTLGNDDFRVIIISVDRGGLTASRAFLDGINVKNLDLYYDAKGVLARKMKAIGYPTTLLITKSGKQYGLLTGPAHWNSKSAHDLIKRLIAGSK